MLGAMFGGETADPQQQGGRRPSAGGGPAQKQEGGGWFADGISGLANRAAGTVMGHALNLGGYTNEKAYMQQIDVAIRTQQIEPWPAEDMIREKLRRQHDLVYETDLYKVNCEVAFTHFANHMSNYLTAKMGEKKFCEIASRLMEANHLKRYSEKSLIKIFQSIDYDCSGSLGIGDWAPTLKYFFAGSEMQKVKSVFQIIDNNRNGSLDKDELRVFLSPLINAMIPSSYSSLRPLILSRLLELLFKEIDVDGDGTISPDEFCKWSTENDLIKVLGKMIEGPVYKVWMRKNLQLSPLDNMMPGSW